MSAKSQWVFDLSDEEIDQTITLLEHDALLIVGGENVTGSVPADPKDEMFLLVYWMDKRM